MKNILAVIIGLALAVSVLNLNAQTSEVKVLKRTISSAQLDGLLDGARSLGIETPSVRLASSNLVMLTVSPRGTNYLITGSTRQVLVASTLTTNSAGVALEAKTYSGGAFAPTAVTAGQMQTLWAAGLSNTAGLDGPEAITPSDFSSINLQRRGATNWLISVRLK